jgi:hypothetical protein
MIDIAHSAADGTTLRGDPRPHHGLVQKAGFRWSGRAGLWYIPNSRDRQPRTETIARLAEQLSAAGVEVTVSIDPAGRPVAERESDLKDRLERRAERLDDKAARLDRSAGAAFERADQLASVIPLGQPILAGHHSERRDRNYRDKVARTMDTAVATHRKAEQIAQAAGATAAHLVRRDTAPVTLRRIDRLEVEARDIARKLTPCRTSDKHGKDKTLTEITCPVCWRDVAVIDGVIAEHGAPSDDYREQLEARAAALDEEIAHWKAHLAALEAAGVKLWGSSDFAAGDLVRYRFGGLHWGKVIRVNKKSVTVAHPGGHGSTITVPWDDVVGRQAAGDAALDPSGSQ